MDTNKLLLTNNILTNYGELKDIVKNYIQTLNPLTQRECIVGLELSLDLIRSHFQKECDLWFICSDCGDTGFGNLQTQTCWNCQSPNISIIEEEIE